MPVTMAPLALPYGNGPKTRRLSGWWRRLRWHARSGPGQQLPPGFCSPMPMSRSLLAISTGSAHTRLRRALWPQSFALGEFSAYYRLVALGQRWLGRIGIPAVTGSNLVVKRQVVCLDAGGFDTDLPCNEDSELGWRLASAHGYRITFAPDIDCPRARSSAPAGPRRRAQDASLDGALHAPLHRLDAETLA